MSSPKVGDSIAVNNHIYRFVGIPDLPDIVWAETGRKAKVYRLNDGRQAYALKAFFPAFQSPDMVKNSAIISRWYMPGLTVAQRIVLTRERHREAIKQFEELRYAVLMPWLEGQLWYNTLTVQALSSSQSISLARNLVRVLSRLERQGLAHCDLSGNNMIHSVDMGIVELVDIEEMFGAELDQPNPVPAGTSGYVPDWIRENGCWEAGADRFAAGIMLGEILCWQFGDIRVARSGDSFFDQDEIGRNSERYSMMRDRMRGIHPDLAELFSKVWSARNIGDCPRIEAWSQVIALLPPARVVPQIIFEPIGLAGEVTLSGVNETSISSDLEREEIETGESGVGGKPRKQGLSGFWGRFGLMVIVLGGFLIIGIIIIKLLGMSVEPAANPVSPSQIVAAASTQGASDGATIGPENTNTPQSVWAAEPTATLAQRVPGGTAISPENANILDYEAVEVSNVEAVAFSPDGRYLAIGARGGLTLYDVAGQYSYSPFSSGTAVQVHTVQFNADGVLVTASVDPVSGRVRAWDLGAHSLIWSLAGDSSLLVVGAAIRQDGAWLATEAAGELRLWRIYSDGPHGYSSLGKASGRPAFSPDGRWLGCWQDDGVGLWDMSDSSMLQLQAPSTDGYGAFVTFSSDSGSFAACGADGVTRIWERKDGWSLRTFTGGGAKGYGIAFSPSGRILAVGYENGTAKILDAKDGFELAAFSAMSGKVSVAFSPDGGLLAAGSENGGVRLYRVNY